MAGAGWSSCLGLAGFVVWVYVVVVLGGGALIGHTDSPSVPLSVLATTVVALLFARVQAALERATIRLGSRRRDAVRRAEPLLGRGHQLRTRPTSCRPGWRCCLPREPGRRWAQVWLNVSDRLTLAATWPTDVDADRTPPALRPEDVVVTDDGLRALPVRHGGQLLGVLRLQERPGLALTLVEERLFAGLAAQAGLVLRWVGLQAELDDRRAELLVRSEEIKASRERLIETQDAERSRLERDLHDGAQQHLVALTVNLRLAHTIVGRSPDRAAAVLSEQADAAQVAIETLSALSRGIYPAAGRPRLGAALRSAVATSPLTVAGNWCCTCSFSAQLRIAELDRLVGQVLGEVIALLGHHRRRNRVVVVDKVRIPLVRLAAEEAVVALEPATESPRALHDDRSTSSAGVRCHLPIAYVFQPCSFSTSAMVPFSDGIRAGEAGKPAEASVIHAMLLLVAFRPVSGSNV